MWLASNGQSWLSCGRVACQVVTMSRPQLSGNRPLSEATGESRCHLTGHHGSDHAVVRLWSMMIQHDPIWSNIIPNDPWNIQRNIMIQYNPNIIQRIYQQRILICHRAVQADPVMAGLVQAEKVWPFREPGKALGTLRKDEESSLCSKIIWETNHVYSWWIRKTMFVNGKPTWENCIHVLY